MFRDSVGLLRNVPVMHKQADVVGNSSLLHSMFDAELPGEFWAQYDSQLFNRGSLKRGIFIFVVDSTYSMLLELTSSSQTVSHLLTKSRAQSQYKYPRYQGSFYV